MTDLTGSRFGLFLVTRELPPINGHAMVETRCDCGAVSTRRKSSLGLQKSCGCHLLRPDCTGQVFGWLTVTGRGETVADKNGNKRKLWRLKCKCGNEIQLRRQAFDQKQYGYKSCGCLNKSHRKGNVSNFPKSKDLSGLKFGELTVIRHVGAKIECLCDCGNTILTASNSIRSIHLSKRKSWINCGERAKHPDGFGLWYPPTPKPLPEAAGQIVKQFIGLTELKSWMVGGELSGVRDEKIDRLIRAAWIITYRRSQGEKFTEDGVRTYILKCLSSAHLAVRSKCARIDKQDNKKIGGRTAMSGNTINELTVEAVEETLSNFYLPKKPKKFRRR